MSLFALACVALWLAADPATPRPFHDINRELTAALKAESGTKDTAIRAKATRDIARLFTEIDNDARLLTSISLQDYRSRARGRLVTIRTDLMRSLARAEKKRTPGEKRQLLSSTQSTLVAASADPLQRELAAQVAAEVALAGYSAGGPTTLVQGIGSGSGAQGGGAVPDYGEELVDLITRTIYPQKWEVNGGTCTIVYYRPLMCLVVSATGTTHDDVDGLLEAMRK